MRSWRLLTAALCLLATTATAQAQSESPDAPGDTPSGEVIVRGQLKRKDGPGVLSIEVTQAANLRELAERHGYNGQSPAEILFTVPAEAILMGKPDGGTAIDTGLWPANAHIALIIYGKVYGGGGKGGDGGIGSSAKSGSRGGDALYVRTPLIVYVAEKGTLEAGGGGGGGAGDEVPRSGNQGPTLIPAGGGGGGFPNGGIGLGTSGADAGRPGTINGAGRGGNNMSMPGTFSGAFGDDRPSMLMKAVPGGNGGNAGRDGDSGGGNRGGGGGGGGYAIRANGISVQLILSGRLRGEIG